MKFGKKNKNENNDVQENVIGKRPSESLGSVLSESVPSASLDIIRSNTLFQLPDTQGGLQRYVVITFDVTTIGGLSKHAAEKNADKGQLIECINAGNIEAYVSATSLEDDKFIIIPTQKTIESLSEFFFLADGNDYSEFIPTVCFVDMGGTMQFAELGFTVDFQWFQEVAEGYIRIEDKLIHSGVGERLQLISTKETDNPYAASDDAINDMEEPVEQERKETSLIDLINGYAEDDAEEYMEEEDSMMDVCPICGEYIIPGTERCPHCGMFLQEEIIEETSEEEKKEEIVQPISDSMVNNAVERLFHASDLELEISAEPFDVRIAAGNEYVSMIEDRKDTWLDSYVSQMVKNANEELRTLHRNNIALARQRYLSLISQASEDIAYSVDYNDLSNAYGRMRDRIIKEKSDRKADLEDEILRRRAELEESWNRELAIIKESAAKAAERNYIDNHAKAHEAASRDVEFLMNDEVDREYQLKLQELNQSRKIDAQKKLDIAVTETLETIAHSYGEMLEQENRKKAEYLDQIQAYVDSHLKDEAARNAVLAETQRQRAEADKVTEEYNRKLQELSAEHKTTCDKMREDLNAAYEHEEIVKRDYDLKLKQAMDNITSLENKYNELMDKYVRIDETKTKEYETRIVTLESDKKAAEEHLIHVDRVHNKFNKVAVAVWVAISVATFATGTLLGSTYFSKGNGLENGHYSIELTGPNEVSQIDK